MKIALCTSDFFAPVQDALRDAGHTVERVYTSCDLDSGFSDKTKAFAEEMRAELKIGRVEEQDLVELEERGVELLLAAAYDYKVPTPEGSSIKSVNVHGSLLPEGRGAWPQPWILLHSPQAAGVTFHSMTQDWDRGDILLQESIVLSERDNLDSLIGKMLVSVRRLADRLFSDFSQIWNNRKPMEGAGSYWKKPTDRQRAIILDEMSVAEAGSLKRAFGSFVLVKEPESGVLTPVSKLEVWEQDHEEKPGSLLAVSPPIKIYALKDGLVSVTFAK